MEYLQFKKLQEGSHLSSTLLRVLAFSTMLWLPQAHASPIHAFFADEHNSSTGNRILEIDLDTMTLVNSLNVPGLSGHHADNTFNSKIYAVPKDSGFINVIKLRKDQNGSTSMENIKQIKLIHEPRSGDAYNKKFNVVLMAANNRPMGSFINVETDEVVGTIGENVDCLLTDGSWLLDHTDANTFQGATKYHCANTDHGGNQISGHPYWLTSNHAAIIDRANRLIAVYYVWQDGNSLKSRIINYVQTRTSVHQIVPRDRSNLPANEQADFYAVEEGRHANPTDYSGGIAHALIKLKLTDAGLQFVKRMYLQRTQVLSKAKADRILSACVANYRNTNNYRHGRTRAQAYDDLFDAEGIVRSPDQDYNNDFPVDCFYPGIPGGHNADFAPNNKHLYVPMAGGAVSIIDVNRWKIVNNVDIGVGSGPGHVCFSKKHGLALTANHANGAVRVIRNINTNRPTISQYLVLPFKHEGISSTYQAHSCYVDQSGDYFYNFWTDGGVFFKIDLNKVKNNTVNGSSAPIVDWVYTGGIPIQGSYISLANIMQTGSYLPFTVKNDFANSGDSGVFIDVLKNDTGSNLSLEAVDPAAHGTVSIANGKLHYVPYAGFSGVEEFWYGASSSSANDWKWGLVTLNVTSSVQSSPLKAYKDVVSTSVDTAISIDVLANDKGNNIRIGLYDDPDNGQTTIANNQLVYSPDNGFSGVDSFWYEVVDATGQTTWGNIIVTVGSSLIARNDWVSVKRGDAIDIDVLDNDAGSNLSISAVDPIWTGSVSIKNNKIHYVASGDFIGDINVWYGATDAQGNDEWAMIGISIIE